MSDLHILEQQLQYEFSDKSLLILALTHRSTGGLNNERLEFLGDAVLGMIVAKALYHHYPDKNEGALSCLRSTLVNGDTIAECARFLTITDYLKVGVGEEKTGGRYRTSLLSCAFEAVVGAVFLDSDWERCSQVVLQWYDAFDPGWKERKPMKDAKSQLQEWCQAQQCELPVYECSVSGLDHEQVFSVQCRVIDKDHMTSAKSSSRRKAEQLAAIKFLEWLDEK